MSAILPEGVKAPEFTLLTQHGTRVHLKDFLGRPLILAFYPADWSPVCGDQMAIYNEILPLFQRYGAELLGISVDSHWSHKAYATQKNLQFSLLSDFEPKGQVAKQYGVYRLEDGFSERALFVIDAKGMIAWSHLSPMLENPGADGILRALKRFSNKEQ